jgi:hypothetical protein
MKQPIFKIAIIIALILWVWCNSYVGFITDMELTFWKSKDPVSIEVNSIYHLDKEPSILYLDAGDAPYFFRANSSCRYSTPLPFQRDNPVNWSLSWMPEFQEEYSCINNYQGKYIIMDTNSNFEFNWIGMDKSNRKDLKNLLENNYTIVWEKCWLIYQKKV